MKKSIFVQNTENYSFIMNLSHNACVGFHDLIFIKIFSNEKTTSNLNGCDHDNSL
jgi:hypothetical protein